MTNDEKERLIRELEIELSAKLDGGRKNLIVPVCPYCGKSGGKFGIYIGPDRGKKKTFMSHCFKCGHTTTSVNKLLSDIGRSDLCVTDRASFDLLEIPDFFKLENEQEIDDELEVIKMPNGYKRCFRNDYLKSRGFVSDDYDYFPVGTTRGLNFKFENYVIFPIYDEGEIVGYVARHEWSKDKIDEYNLQAKLDGKYEIRRYNNSYDNNFSKLLYNYDSIIEGETDTAILCEGVFDVISLTRKLLLYDNHRIVPVATFGKKVSDTQIYKLQSKGIRTIVIGYDGDAVNTINKVAETLSEYFEVFIAKICNPEDDFDSLDFWEIFDIFSDLKTPCEYKLSTVQLTPII